MGFMGGLGRLMGSASAGAVAVSGAATLASGETQALALDFTDSFFQTTTGFYGSAYVLDTGTPANNYNSSPTQTASSLLTYTSPSLKMTRGPGGASSVLRFGAHNLCLQSENIATTWTNVGSVDAVSGETPPTGYTTAYTITDSNDAASGDVYVTQTITTVSGQTYSADVVLKAGSRSWAVVVTTNPTTSTYVNLGTGAFGTTGHTGATIESLGSGWCRVRCPFTSNNTSTTFRVYVAEADLDFTLTRNGTHSIHVTGAHFRRTPSDSTYLATTTAARYALPYEWDASGNLQGILVEEGRTNNQTNSSRLSSWGMYQGSLTLDAVVSPTGLTDAARVVETATSGLHQFYSSNVHPSTSGSPYTFTIFAKANGRTRCQINCQSNMHSSSPHAYYDLSSVSVDNVNPLVTATIEDVGNGWRRLRYTVIANTTNSNTSFYINLVSTGTTTSYAGTAGLGIDFWGAQGEVGSFPTSYIPTIGSTVTRAADNITLATSKFPWDAATDSVYAKFRPLNVAAERRAIQLDDSTANERFTVGSDASANGFAQIVDGGATQLGPLTTGTVTTTAFEQMALAFAANDVALSSDGGAAATDTSATVPTVTTLRFGSGVSAASPLNGILAKALIVPRRMSNADMQTLTT